MKGFEESAFSKFLVKKLNFDPKVKAKNLSKDNKQKLALILALMHRPKIIIMDEPTIGFDPLLQKEIYEILDGMKSKRATIFFSSHIIPEVERIADRVGIIKEGKLVKIESIEELSKKKIRNIEIKFEGKINIVDLKIPGVKKIKKIARGYLI